MVFNKELRFLGAKVDTLSDNKTAYYTLTLYDPESKLSFDTGFIAGKETAQMEERVMEFSFGDTVSCQLVLRKAEKDNRYKIGLRSIS